MELLFSSAETGAFINDPKFYGRMNDPSGSAFLKGPCGDEMEFYLVIGDRVLTEVKYYSEGCAATRACGAMTASMAAGKTLQEALSISAGEVIARVKGLPEDHLHCSILAVSAFYRSVADYLLKK